MRPLFVLLLALSLSAQAETRQASDQPPEAIEAACALQQTTAEGDAALSQCKELATAGSASAAYRLGLAFARGEQIARDLEQASFWLSRAAEQGHANAQFELGLLLERGDLGTADPALAYVLLQLAAINGHDQALEEADRLERRLPSRQYAQALALLSNLFADYQQQLLPKTEETTAPAEDGPDAAASAEIPLQPTQSVP